MPVDLHPLLIQVAGSNPAGVRLRSSAVEQADPPLLVVPPCFGECLWIYICCGFESRQSLAL